MRKGLVLLIALMISSAINAADEQRLLIHRIGPSAATLHTARADGSGERPILAQSALDYNASLSPDGQWIVFTSERDGSADIYRARMDGSSLERLTEHPAYDDQASWSPDGTKITFVSSRASGTTDVWTLDLRTKAARNLTAAPGGDFRPSWSPDGRWIAFSSDRGTEIERDLPEWEHLQRTSIYVVHPDGTGLRRLTHGERFAGSPKWSSDAKRVMFYELNVMDTHKVRGGRQSQVDSQIVSIDLQTGGRREHTSGPGLKVSPQFLAGDNIGYLVKAGPNPGIAYTLGGRGVTGDVRNPTWSTDGGVVVYSRGLTGAGRRNYGPLQSVFSGSPAFHLRHLQSLSAFSRDGRRLALSERTGQTNNEYAVIVMNADGTSRQQVFYEKGSAAMGPQWSQDGNSIVFGLGGGFQTRDTPARIMMMRPDGSDVRTLTTGPGAGFPSLSPDGKRLVFRVWGPGADDRGLRILTLETGVIARLTGSEYDTFPGWSPKGDVIAFSSWRNGDYDIYTIRPDGTGLNQLTTAKGNDAHSSWSPDGEFLMFSSSRFGFKDEAALFDGQPQPYGEIFVMKPDGSDQRPLTDNQWEDGPGAWEPMAQQQSSSASARPAGAVTSLYDLKTDTLLGKPAELASYRGKVTLVVNVASECGFTPQYEGLEKLHRELSGKGFAVLGFPSNDFGGQEPGTAQEIATFCRLNYGVTFPMFAKVSTVPGSQQSPIYKFLGASGNLPAWNFSKYVVGKDGKVVAFFPSKVTPDAPELVSAIAKALAAQ